MSLESKDDPSAEEPSSQEEEDSKAKRSRGEARHGPGPQVVEAVRAVENLCGDLDAEQRATFLEKVAKEMKEYSLRARGEVLTAELQEKLGEEASDSKEGAFPAVLRDVLLPILRVEPPFFQRVDYFIEESYTFYFGSVKFCVCYVGDKEGTASWSLSIGNSHTSWFSGDNPHRASAILGAAATELGIHEVGPRALLDACRAVTEALGGQYVDLWEAVDADDQYPPERP
eukprot:m.223708 g.223708  ORF g.223708 m.223708 type:complete len:229 (-) comp16303_c0_seq1:23-709(-)